MADGTQPAPNEEQVFQGLVNDLLQAFATNFIGGTFKAREELVVDGVLDADKYLQKLAEASDVQARAAYIMASHAAFTNNPKAKQFFERWAASFQNMRDVALAPGIAYEQKITQLNATYRAGLGAEFEAFGKTTSLGGVLPKLATGWDFANLGIALVEGDDQKFAEVAGGMMGAVIGEAVGVFAATALGLVGWPAAIVVGLGAFVLSVAGSEVLDGPILSLISSEDGQNILPSTPRQIELGTMEDDVVTILDGNQGYVFAGDGNDIIYGGSDSDILDGADGNDTIHGEDGDDSLTGGLGDDLLTGGKGSDNLRGEDGFDTYSFSSSDFTAGSFKDTIFDSDGRQPRPSAPRSAGEA